MQSNLNPSLVVLARRPLQQGHRPVGRGAQLCRAILFFTSYRSWLCRVCLVWGNSHVVSTTVGRAWSALGLESRQTCLDWCGNSFVL
jgi:hypothetical protein